MAENRYVIWGSAGHAKVLAGLIDLVGGRVSATFDNDARANGLYGVPLYIGIDGFEQWIATDASPRDVIGLVAIGGNRGGDRMSILEMFEQRGLKIEAIVHPDAVVCSTVSLGAGSQVLANAVVAAATRIGRGCIINHNASVDHECSLGHGVHIAPGATLCGCITVGNYSMIGAGAVVLPRLTIGADAVVGAGAVVTRDVAGGTVVVGNPARVIKGADSV